MSYTPDSCPSQGGFKKIRRWNIEHFDVLRVDVRSPDLGFVYVGVCLHLILQFQFSSQEAGS